MAKKDHSECQALLASLSDYIDGTLGQELCQEIEHHLAECQDCYIMVDTLKKTVYLCHEEAGKCAEIPAEVRARLFKTLNLEDYLKHE
jgi:predicted anti-sigma-YlaC factor YlaD